MPFFSQKVGELVNPEKCSLQNKRCPQMDAVTGVPGAGLEPARRYNLRRILSPLRLFNLN
jgi:hypothetical protein